MWRRRWALGRPRVVAVPSVRVRCVRDGGACAVCGATAVRFVALRCGPRGRVAAAAALRGPSLVSGHLVPGSPFRFHPGQAPRSGPPWSGAGWNPAPDLAVRPSGRLAPATAWPSTRRAELPAVSAYRRIGVTAVVAVAVAVAAGVGVRGRACRVVGSGPGVCRLVWPGPSSPRARALGVVGAVGPAIGPGRCRLPPCGSSCVGRAGGPTGRSAGRVSALNRFVCLAGSVSRPAVGTGPASDGAVRQEGRRRAAGWGQSSVTRGVRGPPSSTAVQRQRRSRPRSRRKAMARRRSPAPMRAKASMAPGRGSK